CAKDSYNWNEFSPELTDGGLDSW
nr:immunoglobulin heavy chain junction region [Macaca mulatta]MOW98480.1 immunoglobulin heavy chain junction region [Macaca mulatta]MOW98618.1 immunoglobulin heavy chain junction region [Macaca mulatta]MOW98642.1 immunoglobulin heavy chain junction region [Macaca mulatta]MOW98693.1 immunoglobulin heavy chain junction region [Macaca mulatta]